MKRESCNHCLCYLELIAKHKETAKKTNDKLTTEKRSQSAYKSWETRRKS